ncbi:IclR family transcriptional regulator [Celeribacter sp.]|uniref:IclR family transcriptional regulator n=1 Tax=Celeribacter sp. TaxID=1890673 RepID=UPI003A92E520
MAEQDAQTADQGAKVSGGVRPLTTALKTLELLNFFSNQSSPTRLADVARENGLSRATAYQRLITLVEAGWLDQDTNGAYRLTMFATRLAAAALEQADLGTRVEPVLGRLANRINETVSLAVIDRGLPCIVARVEVNTPLRAEQRIGTFLSLDGSASGRVLCAFAQEHALEHLRAGAHSLPSEETMQKVREDGFAVSSGYTHSGVIGLAVPVFDAHQKIVAAVSLVQPEGRFDLALTKAPMIEAATEISTLLQGTKDRK